MEGSTSDFNFMLAFILLVADVAKVAGLMEWRDPIYDQLMIAFTVLLRRVAKVAWFTGATGINFRSGQCLRFMFTFTFSVAEVAEVAGFSGWRESFYV